MKKIQGVFFDCWDTLLEFHMLEKRWNVLALEGHAINKDDISWEEVYSFSEDFFHSYYSSRLNYELRVNEILNLFVNQFSIRLDCPIETVTHEILKYLSPERVEGADEFLSFLELNKITYACLSNTIYPVDDTRALLEKFYPTHKFPLVLASYEIGVKKPNPLFFKTGVKNLNLDISDCIYVGDKLYQDCFGSYQSGFGKSIYLNWKNDKEKQILSFPKHVSLDFPYLEVKSYDELTEKIKDDYFELLRR